MIRNRTFAEVQAMIAMLFCVVIPGGLWALFSIKAGEMVKFPEGLTPFIAAAEGITVALLGVQQFRQIQSQNPQPPTKP